jgi:tRNA (cmo5U34)-methyltransferase
VKEPDNLYAQTRKLVDAFTFDESVARVFEDMITRSVPGYPMMLDMLGVLAEQSVKHNTCCYDLGCSLGASTLAIRHNIHQPDCEIIAIDNSTAMIERCKKVIEHDNSPTPVNIQCIDILDVAFKPCSLVSMNLTLQFIEQNQRLPLLAKIANALVDGGVLFLSEKVKFDNAFEQENLTELHHQFKKHQGYSDLEIAQKRSAIENVLIPESIATHKKRLLDAGFSNVIIGLQCFNFVAFIAYK